MVSVVVPVYNPGCHLERCIESLRSQTLKDIEIIFVDDGSNDGSEAVLDEAERLDRRIIVVHKENGGVSSARNAGLNLAKGEYLFFCDPDDWLESSALEIMVQEALRVEADVVSTDFVMELAHGTREKHLFPGSFVSSSPVTISKIQCAILYPQESMFSAEEFSSVLSFGGAAWHHLIRRELVVDAHFSFDSELDGMLEDGLFMLQVFGCASKVSYLQAPTYHYRISEASSTHRYLPDFNYRFQKAIDRLADYGRTHFLGEDFSQGVYMRQLYFVNKACDVYFLHDDNPCDRSDRYQQFLSYLDMRECREAVRNVKLAMFGSRNARIQAFLLKVRQRRLYFWLKERGVKHRKAARGVM